MGRCQILARKTAAWLIPVLLLMLRMSLNVVPTCAQGTATVPPVTKPGSGPWQQVPSWTFWGRVFAGQAGDETHPLQGVSVYLYGANSPDPASGVILDRTITDREGYYKLWTSEIAEFYFIQVSDPQGYTSVYAAS